MTVLHEVPVVPAQLPASAARLVPASVGRPGRVQVIHVSCPTWCVLDHVADRVVSVDDLSHRGEVGHVEVPTMGDDLYSVFEVYAQLFSDPINEDPRMREAAVVVTDGSSDAYMTPEMVDAFADSLVAFAEQVRALARTARG